MSRGKTTSVASGISTQYLRGERTIHKNNATDRRLKTFESLIASINKDNEQNTD